MKWPETIAEAWALQEHGERLMAPEPDDLDAKTERLRLQPLTMTSEEYWNLEDLAQSRKPWSMYLHWALQEVAALREHVLALAGERRRLLDLRRRYEKALREAGLDVEVDLPHGASAKAPGPRAIRIGRGKR